MKLKTTRPPNLSSCGGTYITPGPTQKNIYIEWLTVSLDFREAGSTCFLNAATGDIILSLRWNLAIDPAKPWGYRGSELSSWKPDRRSLLTWDYQGLSASNNIGQRVFCNLDMFTNRDRVAPRGASPRRQTSSQLPNSYPVALNGIRRRSTASQEFTSRCFRTSLPFDILSLRPWF